jgi:hypothetical protein
MIYRHHNCNARHRTYRTVAGCIWKRAHWVTGEGPYALVAKCASGPYSSAVTVTLWETKAEAEKSKTGIDYYGCGGKCTQVHEIVILVPPSEMTPWEDA